MKKIILFTSIISITFAYNIHNCASCHGYNPSNLDKLTAKEIKDTLIAFKTGKKTGQAMPRIAKTLSDEEIKNASQLYGKK